MSNKEPSLEGFDLEYSELIGCTMSHDRSEIELILCCSVRGWRWRRFVENLLHRIKLDKHIFPSSAEFEVGLRMIDVSSLKGLASGWNSGPQEQLFKQGASDIGDFRNIRLNNGRQRLFLEIDDGTIEFEYAECIQRQQPRAA